MNYTLDIDGRSRSVSSAEELQRLLREVEECDTCDIELSQRVGQMKGFERFLYRALGLSTEVRGWSAYILTRGNRACLVFLDEDDNEYRVVDKDLRGRTDERIEFISGSGERSLHRADECVDRELAFRALVSFFEHGRKPDWLAYRKSRKE